MNRPAIVFGGVVVVGVERRKQGAMVVEILGSGQRWGTLWRWPGYLVRQASRVSVKSEVKPHFGLCSPR